MSGSIEELAKIAKKIAEELYPEILKEVGDEEFAEKLSRGLAIAGVALAVAGVPLEEIVKASPEQVKELEPLFEKAGRIEAQIAQVLTGEPEEDLEKAAKAVAAGAYFGALVIAGVPFEEAAKEVAKFLEGLTPEEIARFAQRCPALVKAAPEILKRDSITPEEFAKLLIEHKEELLELGRLGLPYLLKAYKMAKELLGSGSHHW
uniref:HEM_3.C9 n=1 Tax=synthetic construct TaxID=32630 RepID=UPI0030846FC8